MSNEAGSSAREAVAGSSPPSVAGGWEKWHEWHSSNMRSLGDWVCDVVGLSPGMRVLDVGCGTGLPAFEVARRVHPGGAVLGVDLDPAMLESAQRLARAHDVPELELRQMNAETLELEDESFDAVTSCFCVMFCQDPVRAIAEMRRVLRPGGRFAIVVWHQRDLNPFFTTLFGSLAQVLETPPADPRAPGQFRLAPESELEEVVRAGGFEDFEIRSHPLTMRSASFEVHFDAFADMAPPMRDAVAQGETERIERVRAAAVEALRPFSGPDGIAVPATALCAWGRRWPQNWLADPCSLEAATLRLCARAGP